MSSVDVRTIQTASLSEVGRVRTNNEDYCSEFQDASGSRLLVVADGMGGHQGGATASRMTVEAIGDVFTSSTQDPAGLLREALTVANDRVHQMAHENVALRGMGTTAVSLLFAADGTVWVAHVGDSRAYRLHDSKIEPLTADHSVVGEMLRRGLVTAEEAAVHPRRNEILRSVGVEPQVDPDVAQVAIEPGDRFLLCSDGLTGLVSDEEIAAVVLRESPSKAVRTLVDTANDRGSPDNVTVQVAATPRGSTTEIGERSAISGELRHQQQRERARQRRVRRVAAVTALVAGLLALALLWLVLGGSARHERGPAELREPGGSGSSSPGREAPPPPAALFHPQDRSSSST